MSQINTKPSDKTTFPNREYLGTLSDIQNHTAKQLDSITQSINEVYAQQQRLLVITTPLAMSLAGILFFSIYTRYGRPEDVAFIVGLTLCIMLVAAIPMLFIFCLEKIKKAQINEKWKPIIKEQPLLRYIYQDLAPTIYEPRRYERSKHIRKLIGIKDVMQNPILAYMQQSEPNAAGGIDPDDIIVYRTIPNRLIPKLLPGSAVLVNDLIFKYNDTDYQFAYQGDNAYEFIEYSKLYSIT